MEPLMKTRAMISTISSFIISHLHIANTDVHPFPVFITATKL